MRVDPSEIQNRPSMEKFSSLACFPRSFDPIVFFRITFFPLRLSIFLRLTSDVVSSSSKRYQKLICETLRKRCDTVDGFAFANNVNINYESVVNLKNVSPILVSRLLAVPTISSTIQISTFTTSNQSYYFGIILRFASVFSREFLLYEKLRFS